MGRFFIYHRFTSQQVAMQWVLRMAITLGFLSYVDRRKPIERSVIVDGNKVSFYSKIAESIHHWPIVSRLTLVEGYKARLTISFLLKIPGRKSIVVD